MNLDVFQAHKAQVREMTVRTVACMPEEALFAKPLDNSRGFAGIVFHIMQAEHMFCSVLQGGSREPEQAFTEEACPNKEALIAALRRQAEHTRQVLAGLSPERLAQTIKAPFGVELPGEGWLLLLTSHESEHRGNLVILAKMAGITPPDVVDLIREQQARS